MTAPSIPLNSIIVSSRLMEKTTNNLIIVQSVFMTASEQTGLTFYNVNSKAMVTSTCTVNGTIWYI